jgi:hypothetical protein
MNNGSFEVLSFDKVSPKIYFSLLWNIDSNKNLAKLEEIALPQKLKLTLSNLVYMQITRQISVSY